MTKEKKFSKFLKTEKANILLSSIESVSLNPMDGDNHSGVGIRTSSGSIFNIYFKNVDNSKTEQEQTEQSVQEALNYIAYVSDLIDSL
jgi:fructose-1,6-bisphosphatase